MSAARAYPRHLALIAGAIIFTALNLRTAVASVPPLLDEMRVDVPLSAVAAGALTTAPVICMAVGAPIAPHVARRIGTEAAVAALAATMAVGMLLRLAPGIVLDLRVHAPREVERERDAERHDHEHEHVRERED